MSRSGSDGPKGERAPAAGRHCARAITANGAEPRSAFAQSVTRWGGGASFSSKAHCTPVSMAPKAQRSVLGELLVWGDERKLT